MWKNGFLTSWYTKACKTFLYLWTMSLSDLLAVISLHCLTSSLGFCRCFWKVQVTLAWRDLGIHSKKVLLPSTPYSFLSATRCLWWSAGGSRDKDITFTVTQDKEGKTRQDRTMLNGQGKMQKERPGQNKNREDKPRRDWMIWERKFSWSCW